ncbi:MAG TPA: ABC transporter ATP-binding protein, partial [Polyangia bacterium]
SPSLIIADEPTSMLDALWRADILGLLAAQAYNRGRAVLLITHDLQAARSIATRVLVMSAGRIVESGPTEVVLNAPRHASTQALLAALTFARGASAK